MSIRNNMVLSFERNTETVRNGRRSRGPSPNGHGGTPESSSDDDCKYHDAGMFCMCVCIHFPAAPTRLINA